MGEWRTDLENAPRDGTRILGYSEIFPEQVIVSWRSSGFLGEGWEIYPFSEDWLNTINLTHWQHLPQPPKEPTTNG